MKASERRSETAQDRRIAHSPAASSPGSIAHLVPRLIASRHGMQAWLAAWMARYGCGSVITRRANVSGPPR